MKIKEDMTLDETIKAVTKQNKENRYVYSILKQVYNRGMRGNNYRPNYSTTMGTC